MSSFHSYRKLPKHKSRSTHVDPVTRRFHTRKETVYMYRHVKITESDSPDCGSLSPRGRHYSRSRAPDEIEDNYRQCRHRRTASRESSWERYRHPEDTNLMSGALHSDRVPRCSASGHHGADGRFDDALEYINSARRACGRRPGWLPCNNQHCKACYRHHPDRDDERGRKPLKGILKNTNPETSASRFQSAGRQPRRRAIVHYEDEYSDEYSDEYEDESDEEYGSEE